MPPLETFARWLCMIGAALLLSGFVIWLGARFLNIKDLPGTIKWQAGGVTCIIPLLGSVLLSILLTIALNLIIRLFNR